MNLWVNRQLISHVYYEIKVKYCLFFLWAKQTIFKISASNNNGPSAKMKNKGTFWNLSSAALSYFWTNHISKKILTVSSMNIRIYTILITVCKD